MVTGRFAAIFYAASIASGILIAQPSPSIAPSAYPSGAQPPQTDVRIEKRIQTLKYGTDEEISVVLKELLEAKDDSYNHSVLSTLESTRNAALKSEILVFFASREWKGAESAAAEIVRNWATESDDALTAALKYGSAMRSAVVLAEAGPLLETGLERTYARALIMLAGRAGGAPEESRLRSIYDDIEASSNVRESVLLALAEMPFGESTRSFLESIAQNRDEKKIIRMYSIGALGKAKKNESLSVLKLLTQDKDPNVRAQAIRSLSDFGAVSDAEREIGESLRDSNEGVRLEGVRAAGTLSLRALAESLSYRARWDSSMRIREEAMRSLPSLGKDGWDRIDELLALKDFTEGLRLIAFASIAEKGEERLYRHVRKALDEASAKGMADAVRRLAGIIGEKGGKGFEPEARNFLASQDFIVRIQGVGWIKRNPSPALRAELERLRDKDPESQVRRKAQEALGN
jgi:HEAT repeat protein